MNEIYYERFRSLLYEPEFETFLWIMQCFIFYFIFMITAWEFECGPVPINFNGAHHIIYYNPLVWTPTFHPSKIMSLHLKHTAHGIACLLCDLFLQKENIIKTYWLKQKKEFNYKIKIASRTKKEKKCLDHSNCSWSKPKL